MDYTFFFFLNSILLGIGLSADAFSVSVVNGSCIPKMRLRTIVLIAGTFAFFQALMPMTGWFMTTRLISCFNILQKLVPYVSQILLVYLGIKIMAEGKKNRDCGRCPEAIGLNTLLLQAVATSIDALLVGLTISQYGLSMALVCSLIIAAVTFVLCFLGVHLGRCLGMRFLGKASVFGGLTLILIAAENFIRTVF